MFLTTANSYNMPGPLLDRMEIIPLSGYTEDEKHEIAKQHLLAKQIKNHGLKESEFSLSDDGLKELIRRYTREAGVRSLEREIGKLCRKVLTAIVKGSTKSVAVSKDTLKSSVAPGLTDLVNEKLTPLQENIEMMIVSANNVLDKINLVFDDPTRANLRTSVSDFSETISDLKETSKMVNSIVKSNKMSINNTLDNVNSLSKDLSSISSSIKSTDLEITLQNLKESSKNLQD